MNTVSASPEPRRRPAGIGRCPGVVVMDHSLVRPAPHTSAPTGSDYERRVFELCAAVDRPVPVMELAEAAGWPSAVTSVVVSDLIHARRLMPCAPAAPVAASRVLGHLLEGERAQTQEAGTARLLVVGAEGAEGALEAFLRHIGRTYPVGPGPECRDRVVHALKRVGPMYLAVTGVRGPTLARDLWPDLARHAQAALLLVSDRHLGRGRAAAELLTGQEDLPVLVVVHLAGEEELHGSQVRERLGLGERVPVVMVDAHAPSCIAVVASDVYHHLIRTGEGR
ncbi:hypothetical protein [Nocardiopsis sp. LOL_012]|uniref:hypothetical protein n=1 Tax=Nocardiopsis sp. LOL_012 TaxID=3345409 RepID=UPI003A83D5E8